MYISYTHPCGALTGDLQQIWGQVEGMDFSAELCKTNCVVAKAAARNHYPLTDKIRLGHQQIVSGPMTVPRPPRPSFDYIEWHRLSYLVAVALGELGVVIALAALTFVEHRVSFATWDLFTLL